MARPGFLKPVCGDADDAASVLRPGGPGPLALISRPLYVPRPEEPQLALSRWQLPRPAAQAPADLQPFQSHAPNGQGWDELAFTKMLGSERAFVIGGSALVTQYGVVAAWLREENARKRATELINERGWRPLLHALRGRENSQDDLMGQAHISNYLRTMPPPIGRDMEGRKKSAAPLKPHEQRVHHSLKLRKVIELAVLLEAALQLRHERTPSRSRDRFHTVSGRAIEQAAGSYVYDHLWFEPVIYVVSPRPRAIEVGRIVEAEMASGNFQRECGQDPRVLFRVLYGAVSLWSTSVAAAAACNRYYGTDPTAAASAGNGPVATLPVTVRPADFAERWLITTQLSFKVPEQGAFPETARSVFEDVRLFGPIAPAPAMSQGVAVEAAGTQP